MEKPLRTIKNTLPQLIAAERAQVLQWVTRDLGGSAPGIETLSGV